MKRTLVLLLAASLGLLILGCKSSKPASPPPAVQAVDAGSALKPGAPAPAVQAADAGSKASKPASNVPADHTVDAGGKMHKPGLNDPTHNCTKCHGSDLEGGVGPSCTTECHGKLW